MQPTSSTLPPPSPPPSSLYRAVRKMIVSLNRRLFEISSGEGGVGRSGVHTATYTIKFNQSREICLFGQNRLTYPVQSSRFSQNGKIYPIVEISNPRVFPNLIQTRGEYKKKINNREHGEKKRKRRRNAKIKLAVDRRKRKEKKRIILNKIYKVRKKGKSGERRMNVAT